MVLQTRNYDGAVYIMALIGQFQPEQPESVGVSA
jgi:hypothetical protein